MKTNSINNSVSPTLLSIAVVAMGILSAANANADLVFDNFSSGQAANSTGSTPNTFMGDGYTLAAGTTAITGFDLYPVNASGTSYTGIKATIYLWGTVNTGTVNATTPAFGNLLGTYTFTFTDAYTTGFYFPIVGATPGVTPGVLLPSALAISSPTIGITINYQGTTDGINYSSANSLSSVIASGAAPSVGSMVLGGATGGYYRNANSEVNGNFTSTLRSLGLANQGLALRVYGNVTPVPEPTTLALIGAGGVALLAIRRRRA